MPSANALRRASGQKDRPKSVVRRVVVVSITELERISTAALAGLQHAAASYYPTDYLEQSSHKYRYGTWGSKKRPPMKLSRWCFNKSSKYIQS